MHPAPRTECHNLLTIDHVLALSPTEFENLVFDLLLIEGLRNLVWRTPGADGGRDIEGERDRVDFAGFTVVERWYVECKRYSSTLDWPSVDGKRAYAENHRAEALLIVTTAKLSPTCKSEIDRYNKSRMINPKIRFWEGHVLSNMIERHPTLLAKYGIRIDSAVLGLAALPVIHLSQKIAQNLYGIVDGGGDATAAAEACASLLELVVVRIAAWENGSAPHRNPWRQDDHYEWMQLDDSVSFDGFDRFAIRAIVAMTRYCSRGSSIRVRSDEPGVLTISGDRIAIASTICATLSVWANLELSCVNDTAIILRRPSNAEVSQACSAGEN